MIEQTPQTKVQARGCIQIGDLLIFAFGSFIMFAKTADLLGAFAPNNWFGLEPYHYGLAAALLIEGFLVWRKVKSWLVPPTNFVEWAMDFITTLMPFILSITAQVIDGFVTTGLLNSMKEQDKQIATTVVACLIGIPLFLDIVKTTIDNAPAGVFDSIKDESGHVNPFGWLAGFKWGSGKKATMTANALDVNQVLPPANVPASGTNGKVKVKSNPTMGQK